MATRVGFMRQLWQGTGFVITAPVFAPDQRLRGFVLGFCSLDDVFKAGLSSTASMELHTTLIDRGGAPGGVALFRYQVPKGIAEQFAGADDLIFPQQLHTRNFFFADKGWQITCRGSRGYHAATVSLAFLPILPLGLLVTRLSCLYLRQQRRIREDIEQQVVIRTAQLVRAKTEWERTFDSVPDLIMLLDLEFRVIRVNRAQAERAGIPPAEFIGKKCCVALHGPDHSTTYCPNHLHMRNGGEYSFETRLAQLEGDFLISVSPLVNDAGELTGSVHVARDITALKQAERALAVSNNHTRTILDNLPMLAWLKDDEGHFLMVNQQYAEAVGYPRDELLGMTAFDVWPQHLAGLYDSEDREVLRAGLGSQREEWRENRQGEGGSWFETYRSPITDDQGRVIGTVGVARDVAVRKQNEELIMKQQHELQEINSRLEERVAEEIALGRAKDLVAVNREKLASIGQLAAGVAHEINTPLGYVTSNLGLFERHFSRVCSYLNEQEKLLLRALTEEQRRDLSAIAKRLDITYLLQDIPELIAESRDGAERVTRIVADLKSFSRVDLHEYEETDPLICLESALSVLTHELKDVATVERGYEKLPPIPCHPGELNQVFLNLLRNAGQELTSPGVIILKSWFDDEHVYVAVTDNGGGIPPELLEKIFDPFFTTREVGSGTGLGLSVCHDIIARHCGELSVESSVGVGSTFTVKLPRRERHCDGSGGVG